MAKTSNSRKSDSFEESLRLRIKKSKDEIRRILKKDIKLSAKTESQKRLINSIKKNEITICSGIAGSGKSFSTLAICLDLLRNLNNTYEKIYIVKSVTTLKNEELGYIKGGISEKFEPFIWSYKLSFEKLHPDVDFNMLIDADIIRPTPLAYIRGISLDNCLIISDECQNIGINNLKTLMTRIGENSKMILLGDVSQIDLRNKSESSLAPAISKFSGIDNIGTILMDANEDNIRNPIIKIIEEKFNEIENGR